MRGFNARIHMDGLSVCPEILESVWCQFCVPNSVLYVSMSKVMLQRPGIVASVRQGIATSVPQHVRVDWER